MQDGLVTEEFPLVLGYKVIIALPGYQSPSPVIFLFTLERLRCMINNIDKVIQGHYYWHCYLSKVDKLNFRFTWGFEVRLT